MGALRTWGLDIWSSGGVSLGEEDGRLAAERSFRRACFPFRWELLEEQRVVHEGRQLLFLEAE